MSSYAQIALAARVVAELYLSAPSTALQETFADPAAAEEWPLEDARSREALAEITAAQDSAEDLTDDHFQLFVGPGRGSACPYESVQLSDDELLYGTETFAVRDMYAHLGVAAATTDAVPDDHIGLELAYVAECCSRIDQALLADDKAVIRQLLRVFLCEHLDRFAPVLLPQVRDNAQTALYRRLPDLTESVLTAVHALVDETD